MTELGYAGNARYLAMPVALLCVVGGVGLGWLVRAIVAAASSRRVARPVAVATVTVAFVGLSVPALVEVVGDAREVRSEALLDAALPEAIARSGGREGVLACGRPYATALQVPVVAWHLGVATGRVDIVPRAPGVFFRGPPALQPPDAAAPAPTAGGLRPVARVGGWTVSARCG